MKYFYILIVICLPLKNVWGQESIKVTELQLDGLSHKHIKDKVGKHSTFKIDRDILKSGAIASATPLQLNIPNFKNFSFSLGKTKVKSSDYSQNRNGVMDGAKSTVETYGGYLENGKYLRLTTAPGFIYGIIEADKGFYVIDQLKYFLQDKDIEEDNLIMYHTSEIFDQEGMCGLSLDNHSNEMEQDDISTTSYDVDCLILEIATDADYEYYQAYGNNTNNRILGDINNIQPLYEDSFGMELTVVFQNVWTNINDPYHVTDPPQDVNGEIDDVWQDNFSHIKRDVIHLFTGKTFSISAGEVRGSADGIGTICQRETANSFTTNTYQSFGVVAHELGHNLGAVHGDANYCSTSNASVMCTGLKSTPLYFSNSTIARIEDYIAYEGYCLKAPYVTIEPNCDIYSSFCYLSGGGYDYTFSPGEVHGLLLTGLGTSGNGFGDPDWEWERVYGDFEFVSYNPSGGTAYPQNNGEKSIGSYANLQMNSTSSIQFRVRARNDCGWGYWKYFVWDVSVMGGYAYSYYPNPASSEITIENTAFAEGPQKAVANTTSENTATIVIYNFNGAVVKTEGFNLNLESHTIDLSDLKEGNYFMKIGNGRNEETHQIVIRR